MNENPDLSSPLAEFEQSLRMLKPAPAAGFEEMLYQAGRALAIAERGESRHEPSRPWLGFSVGAISGLAAGIAAMCLFILPIESPARLDRPMARNELPPIELAVEPGVDRDVDQEPNGMRPVRSSMPANSWNWIAAIFSSGNDVEPFENSEPTLTIGIGHSSRLSQVNRLPTRQPYSIWTSSNGPKSEILRSGPLSAELIRDLM